MSIVRCTPREWKRFRDVRLRALADAPEAFWHSYEDESSVGENTWREQLANPERAALLAVRSGGDVGVTTVGPPTWDEGADPSHFDLGGFWVAPQARHTEVSRQLLDAALEHAREHDATAVTLWVIGDNPAAQRLYEGAGFAVTGREHLIEARGVTERELIRHF